MKYLLDTPLLVELARAREDEWISHWMDALSEDDICISLLTIGELTRSIESEPNTIVRQQLYAWLNDELLLRFYGKIIPLDLEIIREWGRVAAETTAAGKPLSTTDGLIAATVRVKGLVLMTYNREVYAGTGIDVSDPWQG